MFSVNLTSTVHMYAQGAISGWSVVSALFVVPKDAAKHQIVLNLI